MGSEPLCTVLHEETEIGWDKECSKAHVSTGKAGIEGVGGGIVECLIEAVDVLYTLYEYDGASTKEGWEYLAPVAEMGEFSTDNESGVLIVRMGMEEIEGVGNNGSLGYNDGLVMTCGACGSEMEVALPTLPEQGYGEGLNLEHTLYYLTVCVGGSVCLYDGCLVWV